MTNKNRGATKRKARRRASFCDRISAAFSGDASRLQRLERLDAGMRAAATYDGKQWFAPVQGGGDLMAEPIERTCELRVRYDDFAAGQRYRIEARTLAMSAQAWLYDEQRNVLARAKVLRCGMF